MMKHSEKGTPRRKSGQSAPKSVVGKNSKIHPVVIYPFRQSTDYSDLTALYQMIACLDGDRKSYSRPITVMDRKTHHANVKNREFLDFRSSTVNRYSDLLDAWCVDTCQMWYSGLGNAYEKGNPGDVYWLIPGDFNYGTPGGHEVLGRLHDLPEIVLELEQDICIGEIETDHNHSKQLIDNYGTFALLYHWFPKQAREIRQYTERPRSEFFAIRHEFLGEIMQQRWFAYEQTVVMLLRAVDQQRPISKFFVGNLSDLPDGRDSVTSAIQQVERTERVLKTVWREQFQTSKDWMERYSILESQSDQVRRTAQLILKNLLG